MIMNRYMKNFIFKARRSPLVMNVKGRVDFQKRLPPTWATFIHKLARSNKVLENSSSRMLTLRGDVNFFWGSLFPTDKLPRSAAAAL